MFRKILFATDGSPHSEKGLGVVKGLAKGVGAEVVVLHAYHPLPDYVEDLPADLWNEASAKAVAAGQAITDKAVKVLTEAGEKASGRAVEGSPADAILRTAKDLICDLIVVGARGHGEIAHALGGVSFRVATHSDMPVLIVH